MSDVVSVYGKSFSENLYCQDVQFYYIHCENSFLVLLTDRRWRSTVHKLSPTQSFCGHRKKNVVFALDPFVCTHPFRQRRATEIGMRVHPQLRVMALNTSHKCFQSLAAISLASYYILHSVKKLSITSRTLLNGTLTNVIVSRFRKIWITQSY